MKRVPYIDCWTDYPMIGLGDVAGVEAPMRRVRVVHWDSNKLVWAKVMDDPEQPPHYEQFKAGYLYRNPKIQVPEAKWDLEGRAAHRNHRLRSKLDRKRNVNFCKVFRMACDGGEINDLILWLYDRGNWSEEELSYLHQVKRTHPADGYGFGYGYRYRDRKL